MERPVILCGLGKVGWRVFENVRLAGIPIVAVDDRCAPDDHRLQGVRLVRGDCRDRAVLELAGVSKARAVLILTSNDLVNISAALMARDLDPHVRVVVRLFNQNLIKRLGKAVANTCAFSVSALAAPVLALTALAGQSLGAFSVGDGAYQVAEVTIPDWSPLRNRPVSAVAARHRTLVLAHYPAGGKERLLRDVDPDARLAAGDAVILCGESGALAPLLLETDKEDRTGVSWANWLRRMGRVVWRALAETDRSVKVATGVLVGAVAIGTLVHWFLMHHSLPDGFYRTVRVLATAADPHAENEAPWAKVFVSLLRIAGIALIASFTAILTDYLLHARLSGALEVRRIPERGHVVVCGLGNIGYRVVEELLRWGAPVVVIEKVRDGRFMAPARRLGVAVMVSDATIPEVLRQAHVPTARAVVAATDEELVNLEVALLARDLNPDARVVVRLHDTALAQTLRAAANIRFALSVPNLAAPAFVASLYGDRVHGVFLVRGRFLAVVELHAQAGDGFLDGSAVRILAVDYGLLPVHLARADGGPVTRVMDHRLGPGDRLTVVTTLASLEELVRRKRAPADCAIELTHVPLPARPAVLHWLCAEVGMARAEAEAAVKRPPVRFGRPVTRGQAEELLAVLGREGVRGEVLPAPAGAGRPP